MAEIGIQGFSNTKQSVSLNNVRAIASSTSAAFPGAKQLLPVWRLHDRYKAIRC
jgi:hypothetical protein